MGVVGVIVREQHGIDLGDPGGDQLQSEFRRCVDEQAGARMFDDRTDPGPLVPGIVRAADRAGAPDLRNAETRAGPEEGQLHTVSTFIVLVVPGTSKGTPAVMITCCPGVARLCFTSTSRAWANICS